jgi:hypothetical protein
LDKRGKYISLNLAISGKLNPDKLMSLVERAKHMISDDFSKEMLLQVADSGLYDVVDLISIAKKLGLE